MIRIVLYYGDGTRHAQTINDSLISTPEIAEERARQELAEGLYIKLDRSLTLFPPDLSIDIGELRELAQPDLDIYGPHRVLSNRISMTHGAMTQQVNVQQLGGLLE